MNPKENPQKVIHNIIKKNGHFPNNASLPLLLYKAAFSDCSPDTIEKIFYGNHWIKHWRNGIYSYRHFHSNTHEVLGVYQGNCEVEIGGEGSHVFQIEQGDVLIIPAGVSHKKISSSTDFKCIGAYPLDIDYDMNYGKAEEHPKVDQNILAVPLPKTDPVYGKKGPLFEYWIKK